MAKSLLKFLLLGALSTGASYLPNMLGGMPGTGGGVSALLVPQGSGESSRELRREMAGLQDTVAQLKGLRQARPAAVAGLSDEERGMMQDAAPTLKFKSNTLTRSMGLAPGGKTSDGPAGQIVKSLVSKDGKREGPRFQSFSDFREGLLGLYEDHQAAVAYALWLVPAAAVVLSFLLFLSKMYTVSMLLTSLVFTLANFFIWALSASVVLSTVLTKQSLLAVLPRELWLSPVVFLLVSAGMLRLADENYPFWNKTMHTLLTPIAASCLAAGWLNGAGFLKTMLASASALKT